MHGLARPLLPPLLLGQWTLFVYHTADFQGSCPALPYELGERPSSSSASPSRGLFVRDKHTNELLDVIGELMQMPCTRGCTAPLPLHTLSACAHRRAAALLHCRRPAARRRRGGGGRGAHRDGLRHGGTISPGHPPCRRRGRHPARLGARGASPGGSFAPPSHHSASAICRRHVGSRLPQVLVQGANVDWGGHQWAALLQEPDAAPGDFEPVYLPSDAGFPEPVAFARVCPLPRSSIAGAGVDPEKRAAPE